MAAFSHQYHPFLVDSTFFPNSIIAPLQITSSSTSSSPPHHHINTTAPPSPPQQFPLLHQDMSSSNLVTNQLETSCVDHQSSKITIISDSTELSVTKNHNHNNNNSPETSMVVDNLENGEQVTQKKRKTRKGSSSLSCSSSKSKESRDQERNKKQKKSASNGGVKGEDVKPNKEEKKNKGCNEEQPPAGYIHVRARRGQATDSHSLAERVRREKISERMKMLQRLVPGCDKVTGKALVLDEIINYVQSLQNQVEFLSMKLASVNPLFFDLTMDLDTLFIRPDQKLNSVTPSSPLPYAPQCSPNQGTTFADTNTTIMTSNFSPAIAAADDYLLDYSSPNFLQGGQRPNNVFSEYAGGQFWEVEDQRQKCLNPYGFSNNLCSLN